MEDLGRRRFGLSAQDVAYPRDQFARAEWLGDVTIPADFKGLHTVRFLGARGKKNHRDAGKAFVLADLPAEIESVHAGQHDIEQEKSGLVRGRRRNHRRSGEESRDVIAGVSEVVFDQAGNIQIIFHDKDEIAVARIFRRLQMIHGGKQSSILSRWLSLGTAR